jgi:large subunit ribosomal protein L30e
MDIQRALRTVVATGKVHLGAQQAQRAINAGKARLVIVAQNTPDRDRLVAAAKAKNVPVHEYGGLGTELGPACGKPFAVGVLAVLDAGESDILQLAR